MSLYNQLVDNFTAGVERKQTQTPEHLQKSRRPLKMPKNYDFSVRNVDWRQYENDFLLRTDAVWERSKLLDVFYTHYKSQFIYDKASNKYMIANIRQMPLPTNEPEHFEDWRPFMGYTDVDGCVVSIATLNDHYYSGNSELVPPSLTPQPIQVSLPIRKVIPGICKP